MLQKYIEICIVSNEIPHLNDANIYSLFSLSCLLFVCTSVLRNKGGRDEYDGGETELFVHLEWIRVCAVKETERKSAVKKTKAERQCVGQVFPTL